MHNNFNKVAKKPKNSIEFQNYKNYRNIYTKLRRKAKISYYNNLLQEHRKNSKKIWEILNKLTGKAKKGKTLTDEIMVNGVKMNNVKNISNAFAKHYGEIGKILSDKIQESGPVNDPMIYMKNRTQFNCYFYPTNIEEIEKIIKCLKAKDSSGYDQISNKILKRIYPGIIHGLEIIFNKSLQSGIFPSNMKTAIITPLYKGNSKMQ